MFKPKYNLIIAVQDDEVCWTGQHGDKAKHAFRMPLDQLLESTDTARQLPQWLKGRQKPLCIIPDHGFGNTHYPFQSKKPSLIEPFLERKLTAAYPGQEEIQHFYNYRHVGDGKEQDLEVLFFQEDKSYQLYTVLHNLNHILRQITSPAFLWEERLEEVDEEFAKQGTLLVHHTQHECHLYFYYKGNYQFSRSVVLTGTESALDTILDFFNYIAMGFGQKKKFRIGCN